MNAAEKISPGFNPGDKVRLISGGPDMTVRGRHFDVLANEFRDDMFDCVWFEKDEHGKDDVHYCPFYAAELVNIKHG